MAVAYLDASAIIYWLEGSATSRARMDDLLGSIEEEPSSVLVTSRLAWLECRIKPLREENRAVLGAYDDFFRWSERVSIVEVTASVLDRATEIRARYGFKIPDAVHLASAMEASAVDFLTGDFALSRFPGLRFEIIRP